MDISIINENDFCVLPDSNNDKLPCDSINPQLLSLSMAYVPTQTWEKTYEPVVAISRGTIFPSLDKPFLGKEGVAYD